MHVSKLRIPVFALLTLSLLLTGCLPSSGEMTRVAQTAAARPTATQITPQPWPKPLSRTPTPSPIPISDLGVKATELEGLEITLWHPWSDALGKALEAAVADFNKTNEWGISVKAVSKASYDGLAEALDSAEDDLPEAFIGYGYQAPEAVLPLDPYVDDPTWGMTPAEQEAIPPALWQRELTNGKLLGLPAATSASLLFYNQTWAEELGFSSPPTTPAQFKTQACAAAKADPNDAGAGGWLISTEYPAVLGWLHAFGADILAPGGGGYRFATPEVEKTLRFLRDLQDSGCAWLGDDKAPEDTFAQRRALFMAASPASIPLQEAVFADLSSKDEWTVLPFPSPNGKPALPVYGPSFQISESSPERQLAAWLLVKYLLSPEIQARLAQAGTTFPADPASLEKLSSLTATYPQWEKAFDLLQYAAPEPNLRSWRTVRWAVSDAATQLFRYYFTIDKVSDLAELLDDTAASLHRRSP
jgi:multiple sugar transport system substrate-binding protein